MMNLKRGFFRGWILLTVVWLAFMVIMGWGDITGPISPRLQLTPSGFPPVRELGPLATKPPQSQFSDAPKTWTPDEFRDHAAESAKAAGPGFVIITERLVEHVARSMILPAIVLAVGIAISWAVRGFST